MTPPQVRYSWGKFLPQAQIGTLSTISYIHDGAVGMRDLDVMLLCSKPRLRKIIHHNSRINQNYMAN